MSPLSAALLALLLLCLQPAACEMHQGDRTALLSFLDALEDRGQSLGWETVTDLCNPLRPSPSPALAAPLFSNVVCDSSSPRRITQLHLMNKGLAGTISTHLNSLPSLRVLNLENNHLHGSLNSLNRPSLEYLNLGNNSFTGTIPPHFGTFASLRNLVLSTNSLVSPIPTQLGGLSSLVAMSLARNQFGGSIPTEFGGLSKLVILDMTSSRLSGTIPTEIGRMSSLKNLLLADNRLKSSIPTHIGELGDLFRLSVERNFLSGTIPSEIGNLDSLAHLTLGLNSLQGTIPEDFERLVNLDYLDASGNYLSGELPTFFEHLTYITTLILSKNNFTGPIPTAFPSLGNLRILDLSENRLQGTIPSGWISYLKKMNLGSTSNSFCPMADYSSWASSSDFVPADCSACSPIQCQAGACRFVANQYTCECDPGYAGTLCETRLTCPNVTEGAVFWSGLSLTNVTATCPTGFSGQPSRSCSAQGTWGPIQSPCTRNRCAPVTEGSALWPLSNSLAVVTGTCSAGFSGSVQRTCDEHGQWGEISGTCTRNLCPSVSEGFVTWPQTPSLTISLRACPPGYSGSPSRFCDQHGSWQSISNPCIRNACPSVVEGNAQWGASPSLTLVTGTCQSGFMGSVTRQCSESGQWQSIQGSCTAARCPNITEGGAFWLQSDMSASVSGECPPGTQGPITRSCSSEGQWGAIAGNCSAIVYTTCPPQEYGHASWPVTLGGTVANGTCLTGYTGISKRQCLSNGFWSQTLMVVCQRLVCPKTTEPIYEGTETPAIQWPATNSLNYAAPGCPAGFTGSPYRQCLGDGTWSATRNSCKPV